MPRGLSITFPDAHVLLGGWHRDHTVGPAQRVDVMTALKEMTIWPAWQHFEQETKGSIEVGKVANFTVVDENPLDAAPMRLDQIEVIGTVFRGEWFPVPEGVRERAAAAASRE